MVSKFDTPHSLANKTLFISGASRGIGLAIALRAARDGANVVITGKTCVRHPTLAGTIHSAAQQVEAAGGKALALSMDVRCEEQIAEAVAKSVAHFGGIDILINNAGAVSLTRTSDTTAKRFDLMMDVNVRGAFLCSRECMPHLSKSSNAHILNLSPPLDIQSKWFAPHVAYTISKYAMSFCVLGMAEEFRDLGIAVNALWPKTLIATSALRLIPGAESARARKPEIVAEAAWRIVTRDSKMTTGNFFLDEEVLREGNVDFSVYDMTKGTSLQADLFLD